MQTPFLGVQAEYETASVALISAPYDATTTYMPGARFGPRAILDASQELELYDREFGCELTDQWGIHTLPFLPVWDSPDRMLEQVRSQAAVILGDGKLPFLLGGDHSLTLGAVRAATERYPGLTVVQLDAHADLRDEYHGNPLNHACVTRRILDLGLTVLQAGIRSVCSEEMELIKANSRVVTGFREDLFDPGWWPGALSRIRGARVYLTIDVDVLDPSVMPATGTPEPGGLSWLDLVEMIRLLSREVEIVAADCMELMPIPGLLAPDFAAAKLIYKTLALTQSNAHAGR